jgi:DNA-binding NtrC family response regulator
VLLGKDTSIGLKDLPMQSQVSNGSPVPLAAAVANGYTLKDLEREYILRVIESTYGNKAEAARILGVDRTTLYRKLEEYKVKT